VRRALLNGEIETASQYLGYPYSMEGTVVDGYKVGRKIGFPTANLQLVHTHKLIPAEGVYAVYAQIEDKQWKGMLNIGHRPTLNNGPNLSIEVHILDFNEDIYQKKIRIEFVHFLRPEVRFQSTDELIEQMQKDKEATLRRLSI